MSGRPIVTTQGLKEFNKALKRAGPEFPKLVKRANYAFGMELVRAARVRASSQGGVAPKAARSLKTSRAANAIAVSGGGPRAPYFYGAEFGAWKYRQFRPWRGNRWVGWSGGPGYFLHPTIRANGTDIARRHWVAMESIRRQAFPD